MSTILVLDEMMATVFYYFFLFTIALFAVHRLVLVLIAKQSPPMSEAFARKIFPRVTVQLPVYNERFVVRRLIQHVSRLDWPRNCLQIQILDDSTDETRSIALAEIEPLREHGFNVQYIHRNVREGFKAGALANGLKDATGEFIAIFDADFLPPPDFLRRAMAPFSDATVGLVQTRWDHANRHESSLTETQAMMLDGHFDIEQRARNHANLYFNFNGTAGIWRKRAIEDAGGWTFDTLTEDLDLSYRAQMRGWRFRYLPDVRVPAELPPTFQMLQVQQFRWAKGSAETAKKILPALLSAKTSPRVKLEAVFHLLGNAIYVILLGLAVTLPWALSAKSHDSAVAHVVTCALTATSITSLFVFCGATRGIHDLRTGIGHVRDVIRFISGGIALSVNNGLAVVEGWLGRTSPFLRTPKVGDTGIGTVRAVSDYFSGRANAVIFVFQWAFVAYYLAAAGLFIAEGNFWPLPYLALFLYGFMQAAFRDLAERFGIV